MSAELKACPFCGSEAEMEPWHGGLPTKMIVMCANRADGCMVGPMVTGETEAEAIENWNRRTDLLPPPAADYVAGLEAALQQVVDTYVDGYTADGHCEAFNIATAILAARPASPDTRVVEKWDDFRTVSVSQLETLLAFSDHRGCTMIRAIIDGGQDRG